jgi:hypothetical protein
MTEDPQGTEEQQIDDLAYLLRLWRMRGQGAGGWRASLARPGSGERHGFSNLDDLFLFLRREAGAGAEEDDQEDRMK